MPGIERVFLIADLAGYTALTEAHGGLEAAKVVGRYVELAERALAPAASIVERVGDQLLIVGEQAPPVVETAIRLRDLVETEPLFPAVRSGIDGGAVVEQHGRYFGPALNVTARLAAYARPGQILCTDAVRRSCSSLTACEFHPIGPVRLKNVHVEVSAFEVVAEGQPRQPEIVDPVCRMRVRPETAPARLSLNRRMHYFCSFECASAFAASPDSYLED